MSLSRAALRASKLALALLMFRVRANNHHSTLTPNYTAFLTHFTNGCSDFHVLQTCDYKLNILSNTSCLVNTASFL